MSTLQIDNPEKVTKKVVDSAGRVYVGKEYSGIEIEFVIGRLIEEDREGDSTLDEYPDES
jgi:hypothetical protein